VIAADASRYCSALRIPNTTTSPAINCSATSTRACRPLCGPTHASRRPKSSLNVQRSSGLPRRDSSVASRDKAMTHTRTMAQESQLDYVCSVTADGGDSRRQTTRRPETHLLHRRDTANVLSQLARSERPLARSGLTCQRQTITQGDGFIRAHLEGRKHAAKPILKDP
jgi:hypothetical protein